MLETPTCTRCARTLLRQRSDAARGEVAIQHECVAGYGRVPPVVVPIAPMDEEGTRRGHEPPHAGEAAGDDFFYSEPFRSPNASGS
jgi:hypothetical protein